MSERCACWAWCNFVETLTPIETAQPCVLEDWFRRGPLIVVSARTHEDAARELAERPGERPQAGVIHAPTGAALGVALTVFARDVLEREPRPEIRTHQGKRFQEAVVHNVPDLPEVTRISIVRGTDGSFTAGFHGTLPPMGPINTTVPLITTCLPPGW